MKFLIILILIIPTFIFAEEKVSNSDLSKKLDLILEKVGGLEKRISQLESDNIKFKKEIKQVAKEAKIVTDNLSIPQDEKGKKNFFNKLRIGMESDADRDKGPWTKPETWKSMKRNLTGHKVRMLLGNPNMIKRDLNPRIDQVYHYIGDLNADGVDESANVNFYRDRVISFTSPF